VSAARAAITNLPDCGGLCVNIEYSLYLTKETNRDKYSYLEKRKPNYINRYYYYRNCTKRTRHSEERNPPFETKKKNQTTTT